MYNRQNEYVPYMQRIKRSLNDHRTHLTSQVTDRIYFVSCFKNVVNNIMMPSKEKSTKTLQRAGEEGVSPEVWEGSLILPYIHKLRPF